jgi:ppGpp synthetase/RelA/SpoT-type nucleotidyltranferase
MTTNDLQARYSDEKARLERVRVVMVEQLTALVDDANLTLGVPIESRVKSWASIIGKIQRKGLTPSGLEELDDLIGVRVIFLFQEDVAKFKESFLGKGFDVFSDEDASLRLRESEFGYQSHHYVVAMPEGWKGVPTLANLVGQKVELQVRTLAQHIWAAASHKLQYKREEGVPPPVRRTINRVSALLETVDLELSRVLSERQAYIDGPADSDDGRLDVTTIEAVLDGIYPSTNKDLHFEDYAELLDDLLQLGVGTKAELKRLVQRHLPATMQAEADEVATRHAYDDDFAPGEPESVRLSRGVFFSHVGLARQALQEEFGEAAFREHMSRRWRTQ